MDGSVYILRDHVFLGQFFIIRLVIIAPDLITATTQSLPIITALPQTCACP